MTDPSDQRDANQPGVRPTAALRLPGPVKEGAGGSKGRVYLSWGGEIYGPATAEDVSRGVRTSWFEEGALYWHEGLDEWKPVSAFVSSAEKKAVDDLRRVKAADLPSAPTLPGTLREPRQGQARPHRARPAKPGAGKLAMVLVFALLAVLLTVGILLLLMLV
ncbi:MAG: hypothetical protein JHD33_08730 [Chthoniobacterales bacterium]|jgi:hypothetical protein|nr:hypothetical protein [Chthoniobacterales bacterium]